LTKALPCQWCGQSPNEGVGISEVVSHFSSDRHPDEAGYAHECNDEETGEPAALTVVHSPLSAQKAACKVSSVAVIGSFVRSAYSSGWPCKFFVQSSGEFVDAMLRVDIDLTTLAVLNAADEAASKCIRRGGDLDDVDTLMRLTASQVESVLVGDAKETLRLVPAKVLEQVRPEDLACLLLLRRRGGSEDGPCSFSLLAPSTEARDSFTEGLSFLASMAKPLPVD